MPLWWDRSKMPKNKKADLTYCTEWLCNTGWNKCSGSCSCSCSAKKATFTTGKLDKVTQESPSHRRRPLSEPMFESWRMVAGGLAVQTNIWVAAMFDCDCLHVCVSQTALHLGRWSFGEQRLTTKWRQWVHHLFWCPLMIRVGRGDDDDDPSRTLHPGNGRSPRAQLWGAGPELSTRLLLLWWAGSSCSLICTGWRGWGQECSQTWSACSSGGDCPAHL